MGKVYKIIFLGNTSVGKTTLISQYLYHKVQLPKPTIGIDFLSTSFEVNGKTVRLQLWDTAGQERFRSIIANYTRHTFIAVIVYSIDDPSSLKSVRAWVQDFVLEYNKREDVRIIIVANKTDLQAEEYDSTYKDAREVAEAYSARFVTASALDSSGIKELSDVINECIVESLERGEDEREDAGETNALIAVPRRRCC